MTGWVILVDQPKDLPNAETPHKVITTSEYLARPRLFDMGRPKLVNLARSYAYQSKGYYASLLAEARGHRVVPTVETMLELREAKLYEHALPELEDLIRTTGFFRNKAKSIQGAARVVTEEFGGKVPQTMEEILTLPGVARKTGNVVLGSWYGIAVGVVVDTHVMRLSRRLELTRETAPEKVERDLIKIIPPDRWIAFSHELIHHGRQICVARKPRCVDCTLEKICNSADKTWSSH